MTDAPPLASEQITQEDEALAALCVPNALIFAEYHAHIVDARRRAAQHIARHRIAALSATPAPSDQDASQAQGDTVAFVQEWLMSSDHAPTQWDREFAAAIEARAAGVTDALVAQMVSRFLAWKLPADFNPDGGISFKNVFGQHWPVGTNLLTAAQAEEMVRDMLASLNPTTGAGETEGGK